MWYKKGNEVLWSVRVSFTVITCLLLKSLKHLFWNNLTLGGIQIYMNFPSSLDYKKYTGMYAW